MTQRLGLAVVLVCLVGSASAATYTVTNNSNGSVGSLRWAIDQANANAGTHTITFGPGMDGRTITLDFALPAITRDTVRLDADLDNDGVPDVVLDGVNVNAGSGLILNGQLIEVEGLAIIRFPDAGVEIPGNACQVRRCHLGVGLGGGATLANDDAGVLITGGNEHYIAYNRIAGNSPSHAGVSIRGGNDHTVAHNWFGLKSDGVTALPIDGYGVRITTAWDPDVKWVSVEDNVFANLDFGVEIEGSDDNTVTGNLFGLASDGTTGRPLTACGVRIANGAQRNQIGGSTAAERNVFVGEKDSSYGVICTGIGVTDNRIQGNYFGVNEAGTARRPLRIGIFVGTGAGAQTIGGNTASRGNYINVDAVGGGAIGLDVSGGGDGLWVRNNAFGKRPDGTNAPIGGTHARVGQSADVTFRDNAFVAGGTGISVQGTAAKPARASVYGNAFRACNYGVTIGATGSRALLGNLGNASTTDDGDNWFASSNVEHVRNWSPDTIKAEGNSWDTTSRAAINAKIWDKQDNASLGKVDFDPLQGGVSPTGDTVASLHVTGASAVRTRAGAEVLFTLSAPADVTVEVVNLAGRPIATLAQNAAAEAGVQRLIWSGTAATGLRAPAGRYLVRIVARDAEGRQVNGLTTLEWK